MNVGTIVAQLVLQNQMTPQLQTAIEDLQTASKKVENLGRDMIDFSSRMTALVTVPILAAGAAALKASADFESSFTGVTKTVNGTTEELAKLSGEIRQMAKEIPMGVNQLNAIAESAGQLGVKKEFIKDFTATIAALTVTTNLTADAAANDFARIANVTQLPQSQFSNMAAAVVDLGNKFASNEAEIVNYGLYLAGAGTTAGLTAAEILAVGTAASSAGIKAEAGGTAIQKVWINMTKAVATGNSQLAIFADVASNAAGQSEMTAESFAKLWNTDPAEAFTLFVEGLGTQGEAAFKTLDSLKLMDARLVRTFMNIAQSGDLMRTAIETGTAAFAANSAHIKEADKRYATLHSQIKMTFNELNDAAITAGTALLPTLKSLITDAIIPMVEWLAKLANAFAAAPAPIRNTVIVILAMTAALFPVIFVMGQMITAAATLTAMMPALATAFGAAWAGALGPLSAVLVAVGAITYAVIEWGRRSTEAIDKMTEASAKVAEITRSTASAINSGNLTVMNKSLADLKTGLTEATRAQQGYAQAVLETEREIAKVAAKSTATKNPLFASPTARIDAERARARELERLNAQLAEQRVLYTENAGVMKRYETEIGNVDRAVGELAESEKGNANALIDTGNAAEDAANVFADLTKKIKQQAAETRALIAALDLSEAEYKTLTLAKELGIDISDGLSAAERALTNEVELANKAFEKQAEFLDALQEAKIARSEELEKESANYASANAAMVDYADTVLLLSSFGTNQIGTGVFESSEKGYNDVRAAAQQMLEDMKSKAKDTKSTWDGVADQMGQAFGDAFANMVRTGKFNFAELALSIIDIWIDTLADMFAKWVATQIKMQAVGAATGGGTTGGGTGGLNAGSVGSAASSSGASAATLGVVAVFAAVAYAWYNDNQHQYKQLRDTIGDLSKIFESLSDTLGQYLPAFASAIEVREDGDRFRIKSGTDEGRAEYKYFDDAADAFSAAVLSSLREMLNEGSVFGPGRLGHLGEEAKKVIAGITDEIIQMGQKGVEWLERGLALAGELDNLGKSDFEITLAEARRQYEENIRLAAEYGLSLEKVAELYRRTLSDMEQSLRSRVEQYLPGYDPIGDEFERIRADNAAIQAEYAKQREALQKHIDQVIATIATIANGLPGGTGGGANPFQQYEQYMEMLSSIGLGGGGVQIIGDMIHELELIEQLGSQIGGGGGMSPDTVERIAQQRALLEDLLRQLELMPTGGLTEEEIDAAEREARRRNRRGGAASTVNSDRERLTETMANRAFEIAANGMTELQRELANLNRQREQELLLAHGSAELIAQLNAQYVELEAAIRAANGQQVRDDFQAFMGIGQGSVMTLTDQFTALRDRITEAGFTTERTTAMIARLTQEYERQAAAIIAQGRTDAMAGVQPWIDQSEGVGGQERQVIDMLADFAAARQALVDLARDAEEAGQSTEWLAADIARLGRAQQTAANQLTLNFIGSLKALGANIPADKVMQLAQAQWQLAKAQAIAAAMALAAAGGFKGLTITLEEVLGWITGATFEMSDYYPDLQGFSNGITEVGDAASSAATDMANARDILMDYYNDMLTGPNSPLTIMDQYKVAQGNYAAALAAYQRDKSSENATALTQAADELLDLGAQVYGTATDYYMDLFNGVRGDIGALIGIQGNVLDGNDRFIAAANNTTNAVDRVANVIDMRGSRTNELLQDVLDATRERGDAPPISAGPTPGVVAGWRGR